MIICTAEQIKAWDAFTIKHEPITSINLMERASQKCVEWINTYISPDSSFKIFCGKGNNGGDGLSIARQLLQQGKEVEVFILEFGKLGSPDFQTNLQRLHELPIDIYFIQGSEHFPSLQPGDVIIDALFGSGLNKALDGLTKELVSHLNESGNQIVSIDFPSGLFSDKNSKGNASIKANFTLSFQCYKPAFLVAENADAIGELSILDIGLHKAYLDEAHINYKIADEEFVQSIFKLRKKHSHKGNYGHALLIGGSYGKIGAISLATGACLRSGAGLTTSYIPKCGYTTLQVSQPEAMVITDEDENVIKRKPSDLEKYNVVGVGPGLGTDLATQQMITELASSYHKAMVIDADGLNCLAQHQQFLKQLPSRSILTPHPKEFERLFGTCENDFERMDLAIQKAKELNLVIVLKGHHTLIVLPDGTAYFNSTGNAGMAKGGSGDVLTGIITALLAQNYEPEHAAILGVYLHGLAGDFAAAALSKEAVLARDIITFLSQAFLKMQTSS